MLREVAWLSDQHQLAFICGPTPFVETAAASLVTLGYEPTRIKTERFGPATCTGCGATDAIGALAVYMHGMGTVIRCPSCEIVLIRVAQTKGRYFLDMQGVRVLQISMET